MPVDLELDEAGRAPPSRASTPGTVAVKVTSSPNTDGFRLDDTVVVVSAAPTICDAGAASEPVKLPSPP